jgi:hypothetical protein
MQVELVLRRQNKLLILDLIKCYTATLAPEVILAKRWRTS